MKGGVAGQYESHSHFTVGNVLCNLSMHLCILCKQQLMCGRDPLQMPGLYRVIKVSGYTGCVVWQLLRCAVGTPHLGKLPQHAALDVPCTNTRRASM